MEQSIEPQTIELNDFELKQIAIKSQGGRVEFKWTEHKKEDNISFSENASRDTLRPRNEEIFDIVDSFKTFVCLPKNTSQKSKIGIKGEQQSLDITKVQFFKLDDGSYELDIHYKLNFYGVNASPQSTGRQSIAAIAEAVNIDSSSLEQIVVDAQYNSFCFCILGEVFKGETEEVGIDTKGDMNF